MGDRRRAYLACIATYHVRDYLARAEDVKTKAIDALMRGVCANSFDIVEGICNGSKHSARPTLRLQEFDLPAQDRLGDRQRDGCLGETPDSATPGK
jgi:hypothetical protein